jgi:hypothetical protein
MHRLSNTDPIEHPTVRPFDPLDLEGLTAKEGADLLLQLTNVSVRSIQLGLHARHEIRHARHGSHGFGAPGGLEHWHLEAWPDVPTRYLLCREDRVFPANFLRRVAQERLDITPDQIDGGHLKPNLDPSLCENAVTTVRDDGDGD